MNDELAEPKHMADLRARIDRLEVLDADSARELLRAYDIQRTRVADLHDQVVVGVRMSKLTHRYLESLTHCEHGGHETVEGVLAHLANSAADGIRRPGSWERPWLEQAFGDVPEGEPDGSGYGVAPYSPDIDKPRGRAMMRSELERLKDELYDARLAILELVPVELERELSGHHKCNTLAEVSVWLRELADKLIALAKVDTPNPGAVYDSPRAHCPLCAKGVTSGEVSGSGFAVPEGLRRHLLGRGNVMQCVVTEAVWKLARERVKEG